MTPSTNAKLNIEDPADQEYIRHKLEDAVYMALDGFSLEELAKMKWNDKEVIDWVAENLTIKVTT